MKTNSEIPDGQPQQAPGVSPHDPYVAFRYRDCRLLLAGGVLANTGRLMQSVAVGWELYERTGQPMALGWVGLVQGLPIILLSLPAGHVADRFDRKKVVAVTQLVMVLASLGLAALSYYQGSVPLIYGCLLLGAIALAFNWSASAALLPQTVPLESFSNAVTWRSSGYQVASVVGPALSGFMIAAFHGATLVYVVDALLGLLFAVFVAMIAGKQAVRMAEEVTLRTLMAGFHFVWETKIILATITLDLFAVLFGGATALLPIYAKDILNVGPTGLGWMRAAPAIGAFVTALAFTHLPPSRSIGRTLLWAVIGFGAATVVFGISHWFWLSLLMLALTGAFDNISVVVRHSLVQLRTSDAMRGRVSAVNNVFISASNELGAFESGAVADLSGRMFPSAGAGFGAIFSVVSGGIGTIIVVLLTAKIWPEIRRLKSLNEIKTE
jgi:MFS family permease